jgi:putative membrane protein
MIEPLLAYLHYLSIVLTGGFLIAEMVVCRPGITEEQRRRLPVIDIVFFVSALVALATGLLRLFFYAKGVGFYLGNPFFWAKMVLYVSIAVLSIRPTLTFGRWKRAIASGSAAPAAEEIAGVRRILHIEVGLFALMPLMAVLMARGIGR